MLSGATIGLKGTSGVPAGKGMDPAQEQRPFELVRYFSVTSLVIILLFTFFISYITSTRATDQALKKQERYALLLGENINHQVIVRFVVPALRNYGGINVGQPEQFKILDELVRNTIHSFNVAQVNIMDLEGNIIYSTDTDQIKRVTSNWDAVQMAANGAQVSFIDPKLSFYEMGGGPRRVLRTYLPLRDERAITAELGPPRAVFEIITDMTSDFHDVWMDQMLVVGNLLAMMILVFVILRSIVTRGQRITDQRAARQAKLEEQLNQAERLASLGRMVAGVAHEIRNPLGIVRSTAELLGSQVEEDQKPLAGVIVEESTRLNSIVTEFLDFARPQTPRLAPITIESVLSHNLHVLEPEADRAKVVIKRRYQPDATRIMGDSDLLYRSFLNILMNAVQAMEESGGGSLTINTRMENLNGVRWVVAAVDDTGPGFAKGAQGRLFDPFFTTKEQGTGLGLSIVSNIIASHSGKVEVKDSPGGGARVEVWLPALED